MKKILLKVEESELQFFLKLIKNLDFVHIDENGGDSKEEIEANLVQGWKELNKYKKGELETKSTKEFIDTLSRCGIGP